MNLFRKLLAIATLCFAPPALGQSWVDQNLPNVGTKADNNPPISSSRLNATEFNTLTGAVSDIRNVLYRENSIWRYSNGATIGNGTTSAVSAFNAAIGALPPNSTLNIVGGIFRIDSNITFPQNLNLHFENAALKIDTGKVVVIHGTIDAPPRQQIFIPASTTNNDQAPVQFGVWAGTYGYLPGTITQQTIVYPEWWGTPADGGADDEPYFAMAINSLGYTPDGGTLTIPGSGIGSGGEVHLSGATYRLNETLQFGQESSGMTFSGVGQVTGFDGTTIYCFTQNAAPCMLFGNNGLYDGGVEPLGAGPEQMLVHNFNIVAMNDAGPVFKFGQGGSHDFANIRMVEFNPGVPAIELIANSTIGNQIELISFRQVVISLTQGYHANGSAIYIEAHDGYDVSELRFEDVLINGVGDSATHDAGEGTNYQVWLQEDSAAGVGCANITFDKLRQEEPAGGAIMNAGCRNVTVRNSIDADLQQQLVWNPLIQLKQGGDGGVAFVNSIPNFMLFENDQYFDGNNANPCVKSFCGPGFAAPTFIHMACYGPLEVGACQEPTLIASAFNAGQNTDGGGAGQRGARAFNEYSGQFTGLVGISSTTTPANNWTGNPGPQGDCELLAGQSIGVCDFTYTLSAPQSIPEGDDQYKVLITENTLNTDAGMENLAYRVIKQPGDGGVGDGASRQFQIQASGTASFNHFFHWLIYR